MKPLFDKTEFKKQMSKMFEMETESEKKAYQIKLQVQAEKEMRIIKAELLLGASPPAAQDRPHVSQPPADGESNILKDFYDYIAKKGKT
jgi:hypothetical protein